MAIRTYKVTLDSKNTIAPEPVFLRQGDRTGAVVIDATVMDNGTPVSISGLTPMFRANTADGEAVIADSTGFTIIDAVGGRFTYEVPNALSSVPGKVTTAYFTFTNASGSESTFDVAFVIKAAADITKPQASDYITIIDGTIDTLQQKIDKINAKIPIILDNFATGIKGTYDSLDALKAAFPKGDQGIYVTTDTKQWWYWSVANSAWQAGGPYGSQSLSDGQKKDMAIYIGNENNYIENASFINDDVSAVRHNSGTTVTVDHSYGKTSAHVVGSASLGNTDVYFNLPFTDPTVGGFIGKQWEFSVIVSSSKVSSFKPVMDISSDAGIQRQFLSEQYVLNTLNDRTIIRVVTPKPIDIFDVTNTKWVHFGLATNDPTVDYLIMEPTIKQYIPPTAETNKKLQYENGKIQNLFPDKFLVTRNKNLLVTNAGANKEISFFDNKNWFHVFKSATAGNTDTYYSLNVPTDSRINGNFQHNSWKFKFLLKSDHDADFDVRLDMFDSSLTVHQIPFKHVHVVAGQTYLIDADTPVLNSGAYDISKGLGTVHFAISTNDATPSYYIAEIEISRSPLSAELQGDNVVQKDGITKLGAMLLYYNNAVTVSRSNHQGKDWLKVLHDVNTPVKLPSDTDAYFNFKNIFSDNRFSDFINSPWKFDFTIRTPYPAHINVHLDIFDKTGNLVTIPLSAALVRANDNVKIKTSTPLLRLVYKSDPANIARANFVISCPDSFFEYDITDVTIARITPDLPNDTTDGSVIAKNELPLWLQTYLITNGVQLSSTRLNDTWGVKVIGASSGTGNTDVYYGVNNAYPNVSEFKKHRYNMHIDMVSDVDQNVNLRLDFMNKGAFVGSASLGEFNVKAGVEARLTGYSPDLSKAISGDYDVIHAVIRVSVPMNIVSYVISKWSLTQVPDILVSNNSMINNLPTISINGDLPAKKGDTVIDGFEYSDQGRKIAGFSSTGIQGQTSASFVKKSLKFKLFSDTAMSDKLKFKIIANLPKTNRLTVKAFYSEETLSLDPIANVIMHDLAATRKTFSDKLLGMQYLGFNTGRPVNLLWNGQYYGLYYMRAGQTEDVYNIDDSDPNQFVVEGESESGASMFQAPHVTKWDDGSSQSSLEFEFAANVPDPLSDAQKTAFDNFVNKVYSADVDTFKGFTNAVSKEAAIDYIIFYNLLGSVDSCGRNLEWATWDGGQNFMVIPYDFDQLLFNNYNGTSVSNINADGYPVKQMRTGSTSNKYFDLVAAAYPDEIKARYAELRSGILSESNVLHLFEDYMASIDQMNYDRELEKFPRNVVVNGKYIMDTIYKRFKIVDTQFAKHL